MKKLFILILSAWMLCTASMKAQITFEHTYTITQPGHYNLFLTNLGNNNYKHVIYDYYNAELSLYNLDHTPFMLNIPVPLPDSSVYKSIGYVTSTLFDCDSSNIEYAIISTGSDPDTKFMVYRTDGTLLFSRDSVNTNYCYGCFGGSVEIHPIVNTPDGAKLYLRQGFNGYFEIYVYGLCDSLPVSFMEMKQDILYVQTFPNPSGGQMNFRVTTPSNFEEYELAILNSEFKKVKTMMIKGETEIALDCNALSSGTYFFALQNRSKVFQSGKFVITK